MQIHFCTGNMFFFKLFIVSIVCNFIVFIYLLDYCILYIQPMSLACICKHVTNLYFDFFCYSVMYIYIRDLHAIFF